MQHHRLIHVHSPIPSVHSPIPSVLSPIPSVHSPPGADPCGTPPSRPSPILGSANSVRATRLRSTRLGPFGWVHSVQPNWRSPTAALLFQNLAQPTLHQNFWRFASRLYAILVTPVVLRQVDGSAHPHRPLPLGPLGSARPHRPLPHWPHRLGPIGSAFSTRPTRNGPIGSARPHRPLPLSSLGSAPSARSYRLDSLLLGPRGSANFDRPVWVGPFGSALGSDPSARLIQHVQVCSVRSA